MPIDGGKEGAVLRRQVVDSLVQLLKDRLMALPEGLVQDVDLGAQLGDLAFAVLARHLKHPTQI